MSYLTEVFVDSVAIAAKVVLNLDQVPTSALSPILMVPQMATRVTALSIELPPIFALIPPNRARNEILNTYSAR